MSINDLDPIWAVQEDRIVPEIVATANKIKTYTVNRLSEQYSEKKFNDILGEIHQVLGVWTGLTYVGQRKSEKTENAYQLFFCAVMDLLVFIKDNKKRMDSLERYISDICLYRGTIYRYIGSNRAGNKEAVSPRYNNIFVSWSKNPNNRYLESKLYGPMTWIKCEIKEPYYGIDLDTFEASRGEESEVVFPTIKECIKDIKVIE